MAYSRTTINSSILLLFLLFFTFFDGEINGQIGERARIKWQPSHHAYYNRYGEWQGRFERWPRYYRVYGYPFYGSVYYYSYPLNSTYFYSYPSYYTNYTYPSYPYNGYIYINNYRVPSSQFHPYVPFERRYNYKVNDHALPSSRIYNAKPSIGVFLSP
jgi:hypothetical protein